MAVGDAYMFPGFLKPVLTLFFQSHRLLFSRGSAEVRGENTPERKVTSTGDQTHNHQVISPTCSPLSHLGGADLRRVVVSEQWSLKAGGLFIQVVSNTGLTVVFFLANKSIQSFRT